jgi:hypothetical protein
LGGPIAATNIGIAVEVIVDVDIDAATAPAATPTPAAPPKRAHRDADAKRDRQTSCVISNRRIVNWRVWVYRRTIYNDRIVRRYIYDLWIRLFNNDRALVFDHLSFDLLLLGRF